MQNKFHIVDNRLKNDIMKRIGKAWKDTRSILFHEFYDSTLSKEENVANRPPGIDENHWRWFIDYRLSEKTQVTFPNSLLLMRSISIEIQIMVNFIY